MIKCYLSVKDLAARYSVSVQTIWLWLRKGNLPKPIKLSAQTTRWKSNDIEAYDKLREESNAH